jgi:hypothetical protein
MQNCSHNNLAPATWASLMYYMTMYVGNYFKQLCRMCGTVYMPAAQLKWKKPGTNLHLAILSYLGKAKQISSSKLQ